MAGYPGTIGATLDVSHAWLHSGRMFCRAVSVALSSGQTVELLITTGANPIHVVFAAHSELASTVALLEGVTSPTGGEVVTPYNRNRASTEVSACTMRRGVPGANVTVTGGDDIWPDYLATSKQGGGGSVDFTHEWVSKASTSYLYRLTSAANSNHGHIALVWYEPPA